LAKNRPNRREKYIEINRRFREFSLKLANATVPIFLDAKPHIGENFFHQNLVAVNFVSICHKCLPVVEWD